jgi:hypothetical protein
MSAMQNHNGRGGVDCAAERVVAGDKTIEVARVRITEAGARSAQRALGYGAGRWNRNTPAVHPLGRPAKLPGGLGVLLRQHNSQNLSM